jgi:hypothetical protein
MSFAFKRVAGLEFASINCLNTSLVTILRWAKRTKVRISRE